MMKQLKILTICFLALAFLASGALAKDKNKIGYVDLSRVFDGYYKTIDYDKILEDKHKAIEKERNGKIEKVKEAQGKLDLLNKNERTKLEEDIERMKAELLEYDRQKNTDLQKDRNEKTREILLEIEKVISDFAKKEDYSMILNDRILMYGAEDVNVTEQILEVLNGNQTSKK